MGTAPSDSDVEEELSKKLLELSLLFLELRLSLKAAETASSDEFCRVEAANAVVVVEVAVVRAANRLPQW